MAGIDGARGERRNTGVPGDATGGSALREKF
jgi:hypothetical protein